MTTRKDNLLWLKDLLEQIDDRRQQLEWSEDPRAMQVLTESMQRDLDRCRQLCERLHEQTSDQLQNV